MLGGNRLDRVNELLRHELSKLVRREVDVPKGVLITITRVKVSRDLSEAKVWVSVLPHEQSAEILGLLESRKDGLWNLLRRKLTIEYVPKILFLGDDTEDRAARIERLLDNLNEPG